jgi:peptide/nickel transport system ATP-binding protein
MATTSAIPPVLACQDICCHLPADPRPVQVLHGISFSVQRRTSLGIVGESGAGKSMLIKTIMGLNPAARITGTVQLDGTDVASLPEKKRNAAIGRKVGIVFQNPMTSLNPFVRVGRQIEEHARYHLGLGRREARERAIELLRVVGIADPEECYSFYPHHFSGGMKQRIMIATALACEPDLLIADEATTALDVTVQKEILDLLQIIQEERQMAMILVTHNLGIVAGRTDEVLVLYGGHVVEHGPTDRVFATPRHRYTAALLSAMPQLDQPAHTRLATIPGQPPSLANAPKGCPFAPRCPAAEARCHDTMPAMTVSADGRHRFACHVPVAAGGEIAP